MNNARLALSALALALVCSASAIAQAPAGAPAGSTGLCKDGTYTKNATKSGACGGHKGVQTWFGPAAAPKTTATKPAAPAPAPAPTATASTKPAPPAPTGAITGVCNDGTTTSAATKSGACRGHGGVKSWGAPAPAAPAPVVAKSTPPPPPAPAPAATPAPAKPAPSAPPAKGMPTTAAAGGGPGLVWVNTPTKVYHCPTDRYYGKTKNGSYMTEAAAQAAGDKPDAGKKCF